MKTVSDTLLNRRSIRRYERLQLTDDQLAFIYEAIRNTPTSYNGQQFSVIDVDRPEIKEKLYEMTGQKQIKTCSHFMVFCADYYKISAGARAKKLDMPPFSRTADGLIVGVVDAALAMMSALVAAESLGLGTCPVGYARTADPEGIAQVLDLPQGVFVVCGLAIGVPREMPDIKPKQPVDMVIFDNIYRSDGMEQQVLAYDHVIEMYNKTRAGSKSDNDWVSHMLGYYDEAMKYRMLDALRERGFDVIR